VGTHICTEEDWSKFYKPSKSSKAKIDFVKRKGVMMCLDDLDLKGSQVKKNLFGVDDVHPHRRIDLVYLPCIPEQITPANKGENDTKCLADLEDPDSMTAKLEDSIKYL
jgi:hypothetical protein